jgi:hypothetical protein
LEKEPEEERRKILHPENKNLIIFPIIGIAPFRNEIIQILKRQAGTPDKRIMEILKTSNFVDASGNPTPLGKEYLKILEDIYGFVSAYMSKYLHFSAPWLQSA